MNLANVMICFGKLDTGTGNWYTAHTVKVLVFLTLTF
jgi:hypothetical protein